MTKKQTLKADDVIISTTRVELDRGYGFGDFDQDARDTYMTYRDDEGNLLIDLGDIYRTMQEEYGRCISRVYVDQTEGPPIACGWVFLKRETYQDSDETFLAETWVTLGRRINQDVPRYERVAIGGAP